jgi:amino acid transporter
MEQNITLKRNLTWLDCAGIIVGIIIGIGIFSVFPGLIAQHNISLCLILLAWLFGGVISWFGALCYAELASVFPSAGGDYTYLRNIYSYKGGNIVSFLFAWAQIFVIRPSSIAVLSLIFSNELQKIFLYTGFQGSVNTLILASAIVILLTILNIYHIEIGKNIQNTITVAKILIVLLIIAVGLIKTPILVSNFTPIFLPLDKGIPDVMFGLWSALVLTMWVYGGWNESVYVVEEMKDPLKSMPKTLFFGIFSVAILYIGINFIYINTLTIQGLANTFNPASDITAKWFGARGGIITSGIIVISAVGAINGLTMTGGRMCCAVAKDYSARGIAAIHQVYRTPVNALMFNAVITIALLILSMGKLQFVENLTFYTAGVFWYFLALVVIGLLLLRKVINKKDIPFKVPFYPYLPLMFLLITAGLIWASIKFKPVETLAGMAILTLGIPVYYVVNYNRDRRTESRAEHTISDSTTDGGV